MTQNAKAELMQCYRQITWHSADRHDYDWLKAVFGQYCADHSRILDPFSGSASLSLAATLHGHEVIAADRDPLARIFIEAIRANHRYFKALELCPTAIPDHDASQAVARIQQSGHFDRNPASVLALLHCVSHIARYSLPADAGDLENRYAAIRADAEEFFFQLEPYLLVINKNLCYQAAEIRVLGIRNLVDLCLFDPPGFRAEAADRAWQPVRAFLGLGRQPADPGESVSEEALTPQLQAGYDALKEGGHMLFPLPADHRAQQAVLLAALHRLGLDARSEELQGRPCLSLQKPAQANAA